MEAINRIRMIVEMKQATIGTTNEQRPTQEQLAIVELADAIEALSRVDHTPIELRRYR